MTACHSTTLQQLQNSRVEKSTKKKKKEIDVCDSIECTEESDNESIWGFMMETPKVLEIFNGRTNRSKAWKRIKSLLLDLLS